MSLRVQELRASQGGFDVHVSFSARPGETLALLGPNGAGKSTIVSVLAGLHPPDAGTVELDGRTLDDPARGIAVRPQDRPVGVVFQDLLLFPHLSALENVAFPLRARGARRSDARARALELLGRLDVADRAGARPSHLSGGQAQRVALARALAHEPRLLLLDEPLSALDVGARSRVRDDLDRQLAAFDGIRVLVTHDPIEAMTTADRLVLLDRGRVTQIGTPEEIRASPRSAYAADLVGVNAFVGTLVPLERGAARIRSARGEVVVVTPPGMDAGRRVIGLLRPADVELHVQPPPPGSARNVLPGRILSIAIEQSRARVRLQTSPPVAADVTRGSIERLGLREGTEVWASFKAVEIEVHPI